MSLQSRYTILRKITDGGTAEIFLAKQHGAQGFEKMVVLKRIFPAFYADPQFRHMLVDEAHVAMSLNHSNIVQVLDLGEADGRYFLALELVDGWTLDSVLRRAKTAGVPFPPALALYVTAEVCRALAYAHGKRRDGKGLDIVHRDISPHNVLLSAEGEVKLTDFGIAQTETKKEEHPSKVVIKGKIAFMSPEQASGTPIDARSDLFSLGTMLYVMITRRFPFDAPTDYEALMLVKSGDFMPPETARPGLNPELYRVIRKAMGKTPTDRYQKADEMLVDVEQVMRLAFRAVGQTELQRWLSDLSVKDGVPPLTREAPPETAGPPSTIGPLAAEARARGARPGSRRPGERADGRAQAAPDASQESGVVLDLDDAVEVSERSPPPPPPARSSGPPAPPATEVMMGPPSFDWAAPWYKRRAARVGGGIVLLLLLAVSAKALVGGRRRTGTPRATGAAPAAAPGPAAPKPAAPDRGAPPATQAASAPAPTPAAPITTPAGPAATTSAAVDARAKLAAVPAAAPPASDATGSAPATAEKPPAPAKVEEPPAPVKVEKPPAPEKAPPAVVAHAEPEPAEPAEEPAGDHEPRAHAPEPSAAKTAASAAVASVSVSVKSDPAGSHVSTRHRSYGTTPLSIKLRPGSTYELSFTKSGYTPASKRVHVTTRDAQAVHVTLKKVPEPTTAGAGGKKGAAGSADARPAAPPAKKKDWWKFSR